MSFFFEKEQKFKFKIAQFWERRLCKKTSRFKRFLISLFIAAGGFAIVIFIQHRSGAYYAAVTILTIILISLFANLLQSILFAIALSLLTDYFFIPPVGSVLDTSESRGYFLILVTSAIIVAIFICTLRISFYQTILTKREAEKAVRDRDFLIAVISHELKNPLTAIRSGLQLVQKTTPELQNLPTLKKIVETMDTSTNRMVRLVSDLLDTSRFDSSLVQLKFSQVKIKRLVLEIISALSPIAEAKDLLLQWQISPDCPLEIICDRDRVVQALSNLVGNAIKFTKHGEVTLQVIPLKNEIQFQINDTGPGISKEEIPKVFNRFWQAKETASLGAGLGLSIVKGIAQAHGGRIQVQSTLGKGSTFFFTLPKVPALPTEEIKKRTA